LVVISIYSHQGQVTCGKTILLLSTLVRSSEWDWFWQCTYVRTYLLCHIWECWSSSRIVMVFGRPPKFH